MWVEPQDLDAPVNMMVALKVALSYIQRWIGVYLGLLGLNELDSSGGEVIQPLDKEDHMDMENPIHDGPPPTGGLDVLESVVPLPGKEYSTHSFL